jgi:hypothetical protein
MVRIIAVLFPAGAQPEEAEGEEARHLVQALGWGQVRGNGVHRQFEPRKCILEAYLLAAAPIRLTRVQNLWANHADALERAG